MKLVLLVRRRCENSCSLEHLRYRRPPCWCRCAWGGLWFWCLLIPQIRETDGLWLFHFSCFIMSHIKPYAGGDDGYDAKATDDGSDDDADEEAGIIIITCLSVSRPSSVVSRPGRCHRIIIITCRSGVACVIVIVVNVGRRLWSRLGSRWVVVVVVVGHAARIRVGGPPPPRSAYASN